MFEMGNASVTGTQGLALAPVLSEKNKPTSLNIRMFALANAFISYGS